MTLLIAGKICDLLCLTGTNLSGIRGLLFRLKAIVQTMVLMLAVWRQIKYPKLIVSLKVFIHLDYEYSHVHLDQG